MTTPVATDVEKLVIGYLDSLSGVSAHGDLPANPTLPAHTVERIGGVGPEPRWLDRATLQVLTWGTTRDQARDQAAIAVAALIDMPGVHSFGGASGTVTHVRPVSGPSWNPDENGQPRYLTTVAVFAHP